MINEKKLRVGCCVKPVGIPVLVLSALFEPYEHYEIKMEQISDGLEMREEKQSRLGKDGLHNLIKFLQQVEEDMG